MRDIHELSRPLAEELRRTESGSVDVLATLVNRYAEIDDELERRGANALLDEREKLRERIKDCMADVDTLSYTDEVSGYQARISPSYSDTWDERKVLAALPRPEMADEAFKTVVDGERMKEWARDGSISRLQMERAGALVRKLRSRSLHVGPTKRR